MLYAKAKASLLPGVIAAFKLTERAQNRDPVPWQHPEAQGSEGQVEFDLEHCHVMGAQDDG